MSSVRLLALSRIVAYDRAQGTVTYWYRDHLNQGRKTVETVSRATFIGPLVQHILPKGGKRIRYYGLQATCTLKQMRAQLMTALHVAVQQVMDIGDMPITRPRYRERMLSAFGHDPLMCPRCGGVMWLWQVWHPQYGIVYDELERMKQGGYERDERPVCRPIDPDRTGDARVGPDGHVQLLLFTVPACS
jgi:hypothetical protein